MKKGVKTQVGLGKMGVVIVLKLYLLKGDVTNQIFPILIKCYLAVNINFFIWKNYFKINGKKNNNYIVLLYLIFWKFQ